MTKFLPALVFTILIIPTLMAQNEPDQQPTHGYVHYNDTTFFIYDADQYGKTMPNRVIVTGSFRGWDGNMEAADWQLKPTNDQENIWVLAVPNPNLSVVPPSSMFKFKIDDGIWMNPPGDAPNVRDGNLTFMPGVQAARLRAEMRGKRSLWASVHGENAVRPLNVTAWRLTDINGNEIKIANVLPNTASETLITPAEDLDITRTYYLELPDQSLRSICSFDGWFRNIYSAKPLGANPTDEGTWIRVFAPRATHLRLFLYGGADDSVAFTMHEMEKDDDGVWEYFSEKNMAGTYYDFTVHGPNERGNHFFGTNPVHISDPYARVNVDSYGKSRIWPATVPASPLENGIPPMEDVVSYEVHVQDFTDRLPVSDDIKGTLPAMTVPGLTNSRGEKIGFDHLLDLGINVVHLLPVQEYLHYPNEEWQAAFKDDPYMIEQGINLENYQWGYRTTHAFAIETRFRRRGTEHGAQRDQFRDLVQDFHDKDMAVIVDFVFNHTGENMDGRFMFNHFNALDKQYYYRTRDLEHIGEYGNEVKSENRPMVQRWIIDQCKHFIEEFGVDGFRIDLAGQTDKQTLIALREALGDDIILYGEPWIASNDPDFEANPDWDWYKVDAPFTFFQDDARNAFKGETGEMRDPLVDRGYAGGNANLRESTMLGISNGFADEREANRGINYLDIHDNWALADRFAMHDLDGRKGVDVKPYKLAATLLFTSLGPVVMHGGSEFLRSKAHAPLQELIKETRTGKIYFHGKRDTYNLRTANQFVWETAGLTLDDAGSHNDFQNMYNYWRGLIQFRLSEAGKSLRIGGAVPEDYIVWTTPDDQHLLGYCIDNSILVLMNNDTQDHVFEDINLSETSAEGHWIQIANGETVDHQNGLGVKIAGGQFREIMVPAQTAFIFIKAD